MRQPINPNFERMRLEAERQRLAELEERSSTLREMLEAQVEAAQQSNHALKAENSALKNALEAQANSGGAKAAELEARCEALAADLAERMAAERQQQAELKSLGASLRAQADVERETARALEARCEALAAQLTEQAETDAAAAEKLSTIHSSLTREAETAQGRAAKLETEIADLNGRLADADLASYDPERLRKFIAPALTGALRDAGHEDQDEMVSAIAPYIIGTVKTEILNSEDELVEAIQPRIGTLIRAAITQAVEDLNRKVDDALPVDRWIASAKGRLTGAPAAGWLLEDGNAFVVKEAMLIERQSGILLASERSTLDAGVTAPDEDLMAGMIAALQGFASEAYGATGAGDLRRFSFTEDTVYLRGTPTKLLALRCSGVAPPEVESRVDDLLETALVRMRGDGGGDLLMLDDFNRAEPVDAGGASGSTIAGYALAAAAAVVALIWGHGFVNNAHETRWIASVEQAIAGDTRLTPYPLTVRRDENDAAIVVSGLVPDEAALKALEQRLDWNASPVPIKLDIALVSGANR